jgi:hypothetical protein
LIRDPGLMRRNLHAGRSIRLRRFSPLATLGAAHPRIAAVPLLGMAWRLARKAIDGRAAAAAVTS